MKKTIISLAIASLPAMAGAQSAIDLYNLNKSDLNGTARFMSMGGAFTALGGDLSTLGQNPAGIGVYRGSDLGLTLDLNFQSSKTTAGNAVESINKTHFYCTNFGYVGTARLDSETMPTFSWGATFNRAVNFDRFYGGSFGQLGTSLSNYIAARAEGYAPDVLGEDRSYNPFTDSNADWLSIMGYNTYMINPTGVAGQYQGLYVPGSTGGNGEYWVHEKGYVDEYNITFGGNFVNMIYWGLGFGITDINYQREAFYDEELDNARVYDKYNDNMTNGNAYNALSNYSHISGTGFNVKFGLIFKPINEFRIGAAIHTPTWYNLSENYDANIQYSYGFNFNENGQPMSAYSDDYPSDIAAWNWRMKTPWKLTIGAAGVIGGRFIISADYEYNDYRNMTASAPNRWDNYVELTDVTQDVKNYFKASNTVRIGAEARLTPRFSLRAGYSHTTTNVNNGVNENTQYIYTAGTDPSYTFNKGTDNVAFGLGYRAGSFYIDAAYVHRSTSSTYHAFSPFGSQLVNTPMASVSTKHNDVILTLGFKF